MAQQSTGRRVWLVARNIALFLVLWALLYAPAVLWLDLESAPTDTPLPLSLRLYLEFFGAGSILIAAWVVVRLLDRRSFSSLGFRVESLPRDLAAGLTLGAGMIGVVVLPARILGWAEWSAPEGFSWSVLGGLAAAMMLNTVIQEVMARGYVLQTVESAFGTTAALTVSTVFFAALHAGAVVEGGVLPGVNLLAAGLLLGVGYVRTRNLWLPLSLHFTWNFIQGPVLGVAVTGQVLGGGWHMIRLTGPPIVTGGPFGLEGGLLGTVATGFALGLVVWWPRGAQGSDRVEDPHAW